MGMRMVELELVDLLVVALEEGLTEMLELEEVLEEDLRGVLEEVLMEV